jgi:putative ABC transport system permease protein
MARPATGWLRLLFRFALDGLAGQRGRSGLTILGMAIGTASVVGVVSIGLLGREYVVSLIEGVGSNLVFAYSHGEGVNPEEVSFEDAEAFRRVPGVAAAAPVLTDGQVVSVRGQPLNVDVLGTTASYARVRNMVAVTGRFLTEQEEVNGEKVCVVSRELAQRLTGQPDTAPPTLRLYDLQFRVVGIYREGVESAAAVQKSEAAGLTAIVPFSTFRSLSQKRAVDVVYLQAESPEAVATVKRGVREVLRTRHRDLGNFAIQSLDQYLVLARRVSDTLTLVLIAIAAISLLVGGIGIMNIMLVTVTERTRDIGIRLALGAHRRDILLQFLFEAGILSCAGGMVGVVLGAGVPLYLGAVYEVDVPVSLTSVLVAFGVSVAVGIFFGIYPARRAAAMNIVDALGYE